MNRPLAIYFRAKKDFNATTYYRLILPFHIMERMNLPVAIFADDQTIDINPAQRFMYQSGADICASYQAISDDYDRFIKDMRGMPPAKDDLGELRYTPSFIFDTDDDIFNVPPLNPAFFELGHSDNDGNELKDGQKIWYRNPHTGEAKLWWADGENCDFSRARMLLGKWRETMRSGELVTCSTPRVVDMVNREIGPNAPTHIFPNCVDPSEYPKIDLREHPDEIRILWQGSTSHWDDLWDLREPLGRLAKKHPNTKWIFWTGVQPYQWIADFIPQKQVEFIHWVPYSQYKMRLCTIGHDISLAPLKDIIFNRCRSAIKWYEASSMPTPAATIAEDTGAYHDEIEDGKTGLIYKNLDEFETKLSGLIEDAKLRKELASNAKDWIWTNRLPEPHVQKLYEKLVEVREARKKWPIPEVKNVTVPAKRTNLRRRKNSGSKKRG